MSTNQSPSLEDRYVQLQVQYAKAFRLLILLVQRFYPGLMRVIECDGQEIVDISDRELFELLEDKVKE